jgi:hypothetical protein
MEIDFIDNQLNELFLIENDQIFDLDDSLIKFNDQEDIKLCLSHQIIDLRSINMLLCIIA